LKGEKLDYLPVVLPTKFELVLTQEASERRNCHWLCGLRSADCADISPASFQSMGAENGSTGSMAFLRRLFREL
jgi:hypothetical protein